MFGPKHSQFSLLCALSVFLSANGFSSVPRTTTATPKLDLPTKVSIDDLVPSNTAPKPTSMGPPQKFQLTWELGVEHRIRQRMEERRGSDDPPFIVGVVGIPGSGKTTGSEILAERLSDCGTLHMPFDGYHIPLSELREMENADDLIYRRGAPETFDHEQLIKDLEAIRSGDEMHVRLPSFCHARGDPEYGAIEFDRSKHRVVVCEGLYLLHGEDGWEKVKDHLDLCIYVDANLDLCIERLKFRNKMIPGYTPEEIEVRVDAVDRLNALTVEKYRYRADLHVKSAIAN